MVTFYQGILCLVPGKWSRFSGDTWAFVTDAEEGIVCDSCAARYIETGDVRRLDL